MTKMLYYQKTGLKPHPDSMSNKLMSRGIKLVTLKDLPRPNFKCRYLHMNPLTTGLEMFNY